jgi:hypothetical protein
MENLLASFEALIHGLKKRRDAHRELRVGESNNFREFSEPSDFF